MWLSGLREPSSIIQTLDGFIHLGAATGGGPFVEQITVPRTARKDTRLYEVPGIHGEKGFNMLKLCRVRPAGASNMPRRLITQASLSSCSGASAANAPADVTVSVTLKDKGLTRTIWRQIISETQGDTWQRFNSLLLNQVTLPDLHCLASFLWLL